MEKHSPMEGKLTAFFNRALERDLYDVLELFPIPAEVFSPQGLSLFVNQEFLHFFQIGDAGEIVGRFNILEDPYLHQELGLAGYLRRAFSGEILSVHDVRVPFAEFARRYKGAGGSPSENEIYQDITCFPLRDENGYVVCVVALFVVKRVYQARWDAMEAKAYIQAHWLDDFDQSRIAASVGLSPGHLARIFKKHMGKTPYSYYQEVKLGKIKEALQDPRLSVSEAFAACGADYNGSFAQAFKRDVGMTPSQYRKSLPAQPRYAFGSEASGARGNAAPMSPPVPVCKTRELLFQTAGLIPIPMQVFKQNGDIVFINEAVLKAWNVQDSSRILGKYNLATDPLVNERYGLREQILKTLQGEVALISDIKIPLESFWEWYDARSAEYDIEAIYTDIVNFTVWVEDARESYVVSVFLTSRLYLGRSDATRAKEYLENHWKEDFDIHKLAQAIRLSPSHLARLFKKHTGMTLYSYYQEIKINGLKAALRDRNVSVAQAFGACGLEYNGSFARFFREKVGMTPSQFRKAMRP
ncbi:MAG: AraC family transcriptional regulator [Candidatus Limiplasma sp.]|nr:AraC family transcriptional regulator [Candidatus Limiplasma sp.]